MTLAPAAERALVASVGRAHVLTDADVVASWSRDWTGRFGSPAAAVVRPSSADEVVAVVAACRAHSVAIVPQGGNTGLVGGSVPRAGEVVVSLTRLTDVSVDAAHREAVVGAGVTIAALQAEARRAGLAYGVDWTARGSATVGGSVATDAGGLRVVRHGTTRHQVRGLQAVLGTSALVDESDSLIGVDPGSGVVDVLCGSEGTLGIVTTARLVLVERARARVTATLGLASWQEAADAAAALRDGLVGVAALEGYGRAEAALALEARGARSALDPPPPVLLLVEAEGDEPMEAMAEAVGSLAGLDGVAVAEDPTRQADLWAVREALTESIATLGAPHKLDVAVPLDVVGTFVDEARRRVEALAPDARMWCFGHLGVGGLHVNVTGLAPDDASVDEAVLGLVVELGGDTSAEHGVGVAKRAWATRQRGAAATASMVARKAVFDPDHILNPGVLL